MKLNRFSKLLSEILLRCTAIRARRIDWLLLFVAAAAVLLAIPLEGLARSVAADPTVAAVAAAGAAAAVTGARSSASSECSYGSRSSIRRSVFRLTL